MLKHEEMSQPASSPVTAFIVPKLSDGLNKQSCCLSSCSGETFTVTELNDDKQQQSTDANWC